MVRNSKKKKTFRPEEIMQSLPSETLTQVSLTTRNIYGAIAVNAPGTGTASIYVVPDGYRLKIFTVQHAISSVADNAPSTSYVFTGELNLLSGGTNIISLNMCNADSEFVSTKTFLKDFPYICLPGEQIKLRIYMNGTTGTLARTTVIMNCILEPLNT
jgi:hypothetical protein